MKHQLSRRQFVQGVAVTGIAVSSGAWANPSLPETGRTLMPHLSGKHFDLSIDKALVNYTGKSKIATVINGSLPAPVLHFKEGETVTINVTNNLKEWSSIHWHGLLLPFAMDGVPGISFEGIAPGETFTYQFPILQSGTYWYHSHSGFQEQTGMLGAIVIEPRDGETIKADCDHVVMLSDWTDENPMVLLNKLKSESDFDNYQMPTAVRFISDVRKNGWKGTIFAQNIDRSGFARGTLAVRDGLSAPIPALDKIQWLSMGDMMGDMSGKTTAKHASTEYGFSTDMHVDSPRTNLDDPGVNLRNNGRRVLTYADLRSIGEANDEQSEPTRELELHLTGNMERYIWGFDGLTFQESTPVYIAKGERVRITLVNDTMMTHPMHLHGMWSDLRDANGDFQVRKHTIMVQPAQKISFDVTGEVGRWAWHCHLLYHMESGMFREVVVD